MHLADAFIQSDLLSGYTFFFFFISMCSLGIEPTTFCAANAMLYHWATNMYNCTHNWFPAVCMYVCMYNQKENSVEVPVSEKTIYTSENALN